MAAKSILSPLQLASILICSLLLAGPSPSMAHGFPFFQLKFGFQKKIQAPATEPGLVRVSIVTQSREPKQTVEFNGKLLTDYSPVIKRFFSTTGIVLDHKGNVMTFMGYRWLDMQNHDASIEVSKGGRKWKGKLVGIDQRTGVAVIRVPGGELKKTPLCDDCEVKDGATVMAPVSSEISKLREAQILSIGTSQPAPAPGGWIITVDHPLPDVWQPILTSDRRVLGFIASQDPMGMRNVVYPISPLLESAKNILKNNGDVFAGWLGLFVDSVPAMGPGVLIQRIEPDSPAQNAGFAPGDLLLKYNGRQIRDSWQFVDLVQESPIGSKANVEIMREGKPVTISALIEARKPQKNPGRVSIDLPGVLGTPVAASVPERGAVNQRLLIGVETIFPDPQLAQVLQIPNGVVVVGIQKDSPAERAGILIGDVIMAIDGESFKDALTIANFLQTHNWGAQALVRVSRKGAELAIPVLLSE